MRVFFNADALTEAEQAARWYLDNGGAAPSLAFAQELQRIAGLAASQPGLGSPGPHGTTRLYFRRFPYTLIFRILDGATVPILAVAHQSRRPGYWARRR